MIKKKQMGSNKYYCLKLGKYTTLEVSSNRRSYGLGARYYQGLISNRFEVWFGFWVLDLFHLRRSRTHRDDHK